MRQQTRRNFMWTATSGLASLQISCGDGGALEPPTGDTGTTDGEGMSTDTGGEQTNEIEGTAGCGLRGAGALLGLVPFVDESGTLDVKTGVGLDARLKTDISGLNPGTLTTSNERFYIRTAYPDRIDGNQPWEVKVDGLVEHPAIYHINQLAQRPQREVKVCLECSGNTGSSRFGLLSSAKWRGIELAALIAEVRPSEGASHILVSGFDEHSQSSEKSTPGASWIFPLDQIPASTLLATHMNGELLPRDHGYPLRLIVPGWYGCCQIKWVNEIRFVAEDERATSQMEEFASRTHQLGAPELARDYLPATVDQAAMPVRVEQREVGGRIEYRVVGVTWGGYHHNTQLLVRLGADSDPVPVEYCEPTRGLHDWGLWSHTWRPSRVGRHEITLTIADASVRTRRLDRGHYRRTVEIWAI